MLVIDWCVELDVVCDVAMLARIHRKDTIHQESISRKSRRTIVGLVPDVERRKLDTLGDGADGVLIRWFQETHTGLEDIDLGRSARLAGGRMKGIVSGVAGASRHPHSRKGADAIGRALVRGDPGVALIPVGVGPQPICC